MERKDQEQYVLLLMERLKEMLTANIRSRNAFALIRKKRTGNPNYCMTVPEREVWYSRGIAVPKSAIKRVRIELNEILQKMEKNYENDL